jgi:hypothetical protein
MATLPWAAILFFLVGVVKITSLGYAIALPVIIIAGFLNYYFLDDVVVHEWTGFRCRRCGYDLVGQVEGRCPECGEGFDLKALEACKAGGIPDVSELPKPRGRIATIVVMVFLSLLLVGGVIATITAPRWRRTAPVGPAAAPTSSSPSGEAT